MEVIALEQDEMHLAAQCSLFLVVLQIDVAELHTHLHFLARLKALELLLLYFPFRIQEPNLTVLQHFALEIVIDIVLFLHDLNVLRPNQHAHFRARQVLMIVLNQELIVIRRQHTHLIVYALEDTTLHLAVPLRELPLRHAIFYIILFIHSHLTALLIFLAPNINIFRSNHHIHRIVLTKTGIDTIELLSAERYPLVTDHRTRQNITLTDKIRHKAVLRLVIDIRRRTDLLDLTLAHHNYAVTQRQRLFLIVRHVDKRDTQFLVQLFQLDLHVVTHLQIQRTQRLIQ